MGYSMMLLLIIVGSIVGVGTIVMGIWILACLYQANKRAIRLQCSCGRAAVLYNRDDDYGRIGKCYAYMCECGVRGYIGATKEEAFYGWDLRGNKDAYFKYITAKHGG